MTLRCSFCPPRAVVMMIEAPEKRARICNECLHLGMVALSQTEGVDVDSLGAAARDHLLRPPA
jgi:hypothetical protein